MHGLLNEHCRWIDERTRGQHPFLQPTHHCLYFGEYSARTGWRGGALNDLICDFKRDPARIRASAQPRIVLAWKERAIGNVAQRLRCAFARPAVESQLTFVPIPPSKLPGSAGYCDRLRRALERAFIGWRADIRPLLKQTATTAADHERAGCRASYAELLAVTAVDRSELKRPLRPIVALFDDVLTSGKHLSVAAQRIRELFPEQLIISVCVARRVLPERSGAGSA